MKLFKIFNKTNINKKKNKIDKSSYIEKILKIFLVITLFVLALLGTTEFILFSYKKNEINKTLETLNSEIKELENSKNDLTKLTHSDIQVIKGMFEDKVYNKNILNFKTGKIEFLEKTLRKTTGKFYVTVKIPFVAEKEIDLRKYLLLQSLNKKIYKLTDIRKEKETLIEIIYEL